MILFGQSYYLRFDPKLWAAMQPYPPLGALYAAAYLRARGYDVALFDAMLAETEAEWAAALDRTSPRYAVIFEDNFNYLSKMCLLRMRAAAMQMIALAKARGCTVILCGADMTDHSLEYFAGGADFVLLGEGEETLGELMDSLTGRSARPLTDILGLARPDGPGRERRNPRRPDIRDLDTLPLPAWDLVDVERYRQIWLERHGYFSMNMVTTRGCPYSCNWCAKPIWGQRYNSRSPENVVAELKWLKEQYRPDHIWFADDIFGLKPGWIERFARLVREADAAVPFKCLQRADLVSEAVAAALAAAGCRTVWLGAESGSQRILDAMDKGNQVQDIHNATARLRAYGIEVGFFLQFGYPGEGWEDIQLTLRMVRECAPDDIGISVSYPLPGTKFYERVKGELGEKQNWVDSNDLAMLYRGPYPPEFYRTLHSRVHHEFRLRRAHGPGAGRPFARRLRALARAPYHLLGMLRSEAQLRRMASRKSRVEIPYKKKALFDTRRAFDSVAEDYDGPLGNNALVQRIRARTMAAVLAHAPAGSALLDLGCGTGLDAEFLARRGYRVTAIDWSPRMVRRARARAAQAGLDGAVQIVHLGIHELDRLAEPRFDAAYSNLGALNCVPDLAEAARLIAAALRPGGHLIVSAIGRFCPWEIALFASKGQWRRARLRFARDLVPAPLNGETVWTRYFSPREFEAPFAGAGFERLALRALGLFTPPPYMLAFAQRHPRLIEALQAVEDRVANWPGLREWGDHFLIVMRRG